MRKQSALNVLMFLLSLAGAVAAFFFGEILLVYLQFLPFWLQCGAYLLFIVGVCCIVMVLSEKIKTGYYLLKHDREFGMTAGKAALIFLPIAISLGILTQLLYNWGGITLTTNPKFQGTMVISDISGSMLDNDPDMDSIEAMASYIENVPIGEYLGIIIFNHEIISVREYASVEDQEELDELAQRIRSEVHYDGGTDIQAALLDAISEMRAAARNDWPGLVLLFSDGESPIDFSRIQSASLGNLDNEKNRIPVSTIFYSRTYSNGAHMERIADVTGGQFFHVGYGDNDLELREIFQYSRTAFVWNTDHHLIRYTGALGSNSAIRVILRSVFISLWGILSGIFVVIFLNNNKLIKHFLIPKIIVSVVCAIIFTIIMVSLQNDFGGILARALLAVSMCVMYLPTYRWD